MYPLLTQLCILPCPPLHKFRNGKGKTVSKVTSPSDVINDFVSNLNENFKSLFAKAYFHFVNGRCQFQWSKPSLKTKPLGRLDKGKNVANEGSGLILGWQFLSFK